MELRHRALAEEVVERASLVPPFVTLFAPLQGELPHEADPDAVGGD